MDSSGIPTPPTEDITAIRVATTSAPRKSAASAKSSKQVHRITKRATSNTTRSPVHDHAPLSPNSGDSRHKRVWKACERCRMKKTKCDGEFPCKRCKDDGLVCTAGTRKKTEYKQLPRGYAEVLEHTQFALIATVHKLYSMVRNGQTWELGEPELNDRGQPVIHDIATKLGCIRPNADIDLPPHSVFPEDEAGLSQLAAELEVHQRERDVTREVKMETDSTCNRTDRASSSELDHSDFEQDYRKAMLGENNLQTLSPQSFTSCHDFDVKPSSLPAGLDPSMALFPPQPVPTSMPMWDMGRTTSMHGGDQYMPQMNLDMADMMLSQGLVESEFGTIKPHMISCNNSEAMLGIGDPMIYSGYNMDSMR